MGWGCANRRLNCSTCKRTQWPTFNAHRPNPFTTVVVHHALFVEKNLSTQEKTISPNSDFRTSRVGHTQREATFPRGPSNMASPPLPASPPWRASGRAWMSSAHSRPWPVRHDSRDSSGHAACAFSTAPSQESHAGAECARLRECVCGVLLVAA
jgi:hypothetical protein